MRKEERRRQLAADAAQPLSAAHASVASCKCGTVYVRLHDKAGRIFAYGAMDRPTTLLFCEAIVEEVESVAPIAAAECRGH